MVQAPKKDKKADPGKNPAKAGAAKKGAGAKKKVTHPHPAHLPARDPVTSSCAACVLRGVRLVRTARG